MCSSDLSSYMILVWTLKCTFSFPLHMLMLLILLIILFLFLFFFFFFFFGIGSKMSSTSVSDRAPNGLRYVNKTCHCGHRAKVRISEFDMNMNKLYYCCPHDKCRFFRWCIPIIEFEATSSTVDVSQLLHEVH